MGKWVLLRSALLSNWPRYNACTVEVTAFLQHTTDFSGGGARAGGITGVVQRLVVSLSAVEVNQLEG